MCSCTWQASDAGRTAREGTAGMAQIEQGDGFETLAIHAGQEPDPLTGAVVPPIYQVSTYKQDGVGGLRGGALSGIGSSAGRWVEGYEYSRTASARAPPSSAGAGVRVGDGRRGLPDPHGLPA